MKCLIVVAVVLQTALCGHLSVRSPYINPGFTYFNGQSAIAPGHAAYTTSTFYGNSRLAGKLTAGAPFFAAPFHAAPLVAAPAAAVVPTVHQVPAVADVPVTRIEAQPGYIHKELDVAKPAVKTSRFELRRPAIQKEFYDIEERVIVRPAGSALVELDQPHSKIQKSSLVSPVLPAHFAHPVVAPPQFNPSFISVSPAPPNFVSPAPPGFVSPAPPQNIETNPRPIGDGSFAADDESVVVEARSRAQDLQTRARFEQNLQRTAQPQQTLREQPQVLIAAQESAANQQQLVNFLAARNNANEVKYNGHAFRDIGDAAEVRSRIAQPALRIQPEARLAPQDSNGNQQRLIDLLTARDGVVDVGFSNPAFKNIGDIGTIRARVLQAEYAPKNVPVTGERVNTRRVVVTRPIETIEEVDVVEPFTKLERVTVQHPALFKTAHVGIARVPTSVPVLGKSFAPVAQLTHSPIYYN